MIDSREMFETYFKTVWKGIDLIQTIGEDFAFKLLDGKYVEDIVEEHWRTWQASAQRQGHKLVPCEPTYKQLDALKNSCELFKKAGVSDLEAHGAYKAMIGASE